MELIMNVTSLFRDRNKGGGRGGGQKDYKCTGIVADDGESFDLGFEQSLDQVFGNATKAEPADQQLRPILKTITDNGEGTMRL
jgi:hypothetical protein